MSEALQHALDAVPGDDLMSAKIRALMRGYDRHWRNAGWETLGVEEEYQLPLVNPDTRATSRTFTHAGKFDGRAMYQGKLYLVEHKSTSEDVADADSVYWRRLVIESQISGYALASWQQGMKVDGILYDVIKKPGIRPKQITKADQKAMLATQEYCGFVVTHRDDFGYITEEDNTLYELRLTQDVMQNPEKYFQRRVIPRMDSEIVEFAGELWDVAKTILEARNHDRNYRNPDACMMYGTPCRFLGVCSGYDNFESGQWHRAAQVHSELLIIDGDERGGRDVITASRVKCFQSCRRKHHYQYEEGWRKNDKDESEALQFGAALHQSLESWWSSFKGQSDGDNAADAANEVASASVETGERLPVGSEE